MKRTLWAILLGTTAFLSPEMAYADAATGVRVGTLIAAVALSFVPGVGPLLSALVTAAGNVAAQALTKVPGPQQREARTTSFDVHPNFRFPFGEFPQGGRVVMHHVEGQVYYLVYLLSSTPIEGLTKIEMADGVELDIPGITGTTENADYNGVSVPQNIEDMDVGAGAQGPDPYGVSDEPDIKFWLGKGDHTQPPQQWLDEIPDVISATDIWKGVAVLFVRLVDDNPKLNSDRYGTGRPPPFRIYGKWAKVYDPRRDSTSGVTGAGGSHRHDDPSTWEYFASDDGSEIGANPALAFLTVATHTYALGYDTEMIPIAQIARAADDCGYGTSQTISLDPVTNAGTTHAAAYANGITVSGVDSGQLVRITLPSGQTYGSFSPWGAPEKDGANTGTTTVFYVAIDGDYANATELGDNNGGAYYDGYEEARAAFGAAVVSGGSSYTFYVVDTLIPDNTGGMEVLVEALPRYRVDGLVTIQQRDFSLFADILAACAGSLDTTDGLLGLRVGVWEAPTHTMTQPIGDEISVDGARDSGYDKVVAKFISRDRNFEEDDGPGWDIRDTGSRTHTLDLSLVREREQAARLEKIAAGQMEPDRIVTATWDGRESMRRVGERVNFALTDWARSSSTYVVESIQPLWTDASGDAQERGNGLANEFRITLREDEEATYTFTLADYTAADPADLPTVTPPTVTAPTAVTAEQSDALETDGTARPRLLVTVTNSSTAGDVRIEYSTDGGSTWAHLALALGGATVTAYLDPAIVGVTYKARARRENSAVGVSAWVESNSVTIVAASAEGLTLEDDSGLLKLETGFAIVLE